jgi:hypothetical protein
VGQGGDLGMERGTLQVWPRASAYYCNERKPPLGIKSLRERKRNRDLSTQAACGWKMHGPRPTALQVALHRGPPPSPQGLTSACCHEGKCPVGGQICAHWPRLKRSPFLGEPKGQSCSATLAASGSAAPPTPFPPTSLPEQPQHCPAGCPPGHSRSPQHPAYSGA